MPAEYRAALEGCALFDETHRGRIEVRGADATGFLHRILASDVRSLGAGGGQRSLLLSSKGKVLFDMDLFRAPDSVWMSTPAGSAGALVAALENYHFAEKLEIVSREAGSAPVALCGPAADGIVMEVCGTVPPADPYAWLPARFQGTEAVLARVPVAGSLGIRVDAGPQHAGALWTALRGAGATAAGRVARDALRVEAGAALYGEDVDENVYPQEARLESAFSLTKGCFVGQEVVAKIDTYGGLNKRIMALRIAHSDPVPRGTRLVREDEGELRDLGVVTSWAYSFVLDTGVALGYVKRRHQDAGTTFRLGESDTQAVIVPLPIRAGAIPPTGSNP